MTSWIFKKWNVGERKISLWWQLWLVSIHQNWNQVYVTLISSYNLSPSPRLLDKVTRYHDHKRYRQFKLVEVAECKKSSSDDAILVASDVHFPSIPKQKQVFNSRKEKDCSGHNSFNVHLSICKSDTTQKLLLCPKRDFRRTFKWQQPHQVNPQKLQCTDAVANYLWLGRV